MIIFQCVILLLSLLLYFLYQPLSVLDVAVERSVISQRKIPWNTLPRPGIEPGPRGGQTVRYSHVPTELYYYMLHGNFCINIPH